MLPRRDFYDIKVSSKGKLDVLDLASCDRHIPVEGAFEKKKWFGKDYRSYTFQYTPDKEEQQCTLFIGAYDEKGRHGWAIVDFETPGMPAEIKCNGEKSFHNGSSICQSKVGLVQKIRLDEPVITDPDCPLFKDGDYYTYPIQAGSCVFVFMNSKGEIHRHISYGYEQILIRNWE